MKQARNYSFLDRLCLGFDQSLRAVCNTAKTTGRPNPSIDVVESDLSSEQRKHSSSLMRINHTGEVCAQALYHGQGLVSKSSSVKKKMQKSAIEEGDHLNWCHHRLSELGSHTSYLNPIWYVGSFTIGVAAGLIGDKWSLGFLAETENQVVHHLEKHMKVLKLKDDKSYKILEQMKIDESIHMDDAIKAGGKKLPLFVQGMMYKMSKVMVKVTYFV
ncbi:2-polyprenyl-3-methyl-6-methoxy-1,4-benzoquinone monooxygenase [Gammaproteobacteria bacterium]|nr:2-polyprenyl-3-methyl-6-methoxy-1,4-benzoquinone monooxygenase [Gammaproteobacteria bacterium]